MFCFPYAGGSSAVFNRWRQWLDKNIQLKPVELSGRGKRIYDPLYNNLEEAVDDLFQLLSRELKQQPYAFFGHSMGGIISYELAYKIREKNLPPPLHLFFSGRGAPHIPCEDSEMWYNLPDEEFKHKVIELGGTPKEFFEHPELLEVLVPMLRSDFKMAETYRHPGEINPFDQDITVFLGKDEEVTAEQVHGWKEHTRKNCAIHFLEGGHFFVNSQTQKLLKIINTTLPA